MYYSFFFPAFAHKRKKWQNTSFLHHFHRLLEELFYNKEFKLDVNDELIFKKHFIAIYLSFDEE